MGKSASGEEKQLAIFPEVIEQEQACREVAYQQFRAQCLPCFILLLGPHDCAVLYTKAIESALRQTFDIEPEAGLVVACAQAIEALWTACGFFEPLLTSLFTIEEYLSDNNFPMPPLFTAVVKYLEEET